MSDEEKRKRAPKRCLFCNQEFEKGEHFEVIKGEDQPTKYFHYKCFVEYRDKIRRGGVVLDVFR